MKLIGRDIWHKSVIVMCDCHAEMIQISQFEKNDGEFVFSYFGNNCTSPKKDEWCEFLMYREQFLDFVDFINRAATCPEEFMETTYSEKNNGYETTTHVLRLYVDECGYLTIERIDITDNKECVIWEIIINTNNTKELSDELNSWEV